jgi:hypothetical protein
MAQGNKGGNYRWRDSETGQYLKEQDARRRPPSEVERERIKPQTPPKKSK